MVSHLQWKQASKPNASTPQNAKNNIVHKTQKFAYNSRVC
jgi:hypothetical protein